MAEIVKTHRRKARTIIKTATIRAATIPIIEQSAKPAPRIITLDNRQEDRVSYIRRYVAIQGKIERLYAEAARLIGAEIRRREQPDGKISATLSNLTALQRDLFGIWSDTFGGTASPLYQEILGEMEIATRAGARFTVDQTAKDAPDKAAMMIRFNEIDPTLAVAIARGDNTTKLVYTGNANGISLSERIWTDARNQWQQIYAEIGRRVLLGQDARQVAHSVEKYIKGDTVRGYTPWKSAVRIARTEMADAFRAGQIEAYAQMDFVTGVKWNLSASHRASGCRCEQQSRQDLYDMGPGVYPVDKVPGIPHPHCLCYLTSIIKDENAET